MHGVRRYVGSVGLGRWLFPSLLVLTGCRAPTEVTLVLRTDVPCAELTGVTIGLRGDLVPRTESRSCDANGELGGIVLVPSGSKTATLDIEIAAGRGVEPATCASAFGPGCIIARRKLRYLPHEPLTVPIDLRGACAGVACAQGATCVAGICHLADVDPSSCTTSAGCGEYALGPPDTRPPPTPPPTPPPPTTNGPFYVDGTSNQTFATGTSTLSLIVPPKVVAGDLLILGAYTDLSVSTLALPPGWTSQRSVTSTTHNWRGWLASRVAVGNDPPVDLSLGSVGTNGSAAVLVAYRRASPTPSSPWVFALVNQATQGTSYPSFAVTGTRSDALLVLFYMSDAAGGAATDWVAPAGTSSRQANKNLLVVDVPAASPGMPSYAATFKNGSGAVAGANFAP